MPRDVKRSVKSSFPFCNVKREDEFENEKIRLSGTRYWVEKVYYLEGLGTFFINVCGILDI